MRGWLAALTALGSLSTPAWAELPAPEAYQLHCSGCHGAHGKGIEGVTPSLHELVSLLAEPGGREYLVRVPGVAQAPLENGQLAQLMNWILREFSTDTHFVPYEAIEIQRWRKRPFRDPLAQRPNRTPRRIDAAIREEASAQP
jgi:hypothetical protein